MKLQLQKTLIVLFTFLALGSTILAQSIKRDEMDRFTKKRVIETSYATWFSLKFGISKFGLTFMLSCADGKYTMPTAIITKELVKFTSEDGIILLLDNDDTITLTTVFTGIGGMEIHRWYEFSTCFELSDTDIETLTHNNVVAVRVMYLGGHIDQNIKKRDQSLLRDMIQLIEQQKKENCPKTKENKLKDDKAFW